MVLRKLRWLTAGVLAAVALLAAPAKSDAAVSILVQEIDSAGNPIPGTSTLFNSASVAGYSTTNFAQITVGTSSNSSLSVPNASLSTGFSFLNSSIVAGSLPAGIGLQIIVTDTFTRAPGGDPALVNSSIGAANGSTGFIGDITVSSQTAILDSTGTTTLATTPTASATSPSGTATGPQFANVSSLPATFEVQQTITIRVTGDGQNVPVGQAYSGAVASATVAVPAPAGLVLALAAVPMLGLRRVLRRKA